MTNEIKKKKILLSTKKLCVRTTENLLPRFKQIVKRCNSSYSDEKYCLACTKQLEVIQKCWAYDHVCKDFRNPMKLRSNENLFRLNECEAALDADFKRTDVASNCLGRTLVEIYCLI